MYDFFCLLSFFISLNEQVMNPRRKNTGQRRKNPPRKEVRMRWKEQVQEAPMKNHKVNVRKWKEMRAMEVMRLITMIWKTNKTSAGPACSDILDLCKTASYSPKGHKTTENI